MVWSTKARVGAILVLVLALVIPPLAVYLTLRPRLATGPAEAVGGTASRPVAQPYFTVVGTGGVTGVYYPAGGAICRLVNRNRKEHGIRCSVESTGGSIYNIEAIRGGELDFGLVQSDWQFHAYNGSSRFEEPGPFGELRALFSLHAEPFTVLARADSDIGSFQDLKGKRVNIGNVGSGQRATMEVVMEELDWTTSDFASATELKSAEQAQALCDDQIDAVVFTVGHPSGAILEAVDECGAVLIPVTGVEIDRLVAENSYYMEVEIPGGLYAGNPRSIPTFGVGATVVTSATVPEDVVYEIVKAVFEDFEQFTSLHPAFMGLSPERMVRYGLSAPLHEGALRYYQERGWL